MTDPQRRLGHVVLRVRSLAVSVPFYTSVLGLHEVARLDGPERVALAHSRDHEVSQSLYLRDPDGLLVEVYVDADPAV